MALPRIKLLGSGSTLASRGADSLALTRYGKKFSGLPHLSPADLVAGLPELGRFARVEPDVDFTGDPSPQGPPLWLPLARRVNAVLRGRGVAGAVVVHGTNTLEETAYFLHLTVDSDKPVVVVGAQRPWTALSSDGPMNLLNAVRTAAAPHSRGRGVLVVLNDEIHSAREVTKTSTFKLQAFRGPDVGLLGHADPDQIVYYRRQERRHTRQSEFRVEGVEALPRVDVVLAYGGSDGGLVEAAVRLGARGIVVGGTGGGSPDGMREALRAAMAQGVAVVLSSRVGSGRVMADSSYPEPGMVAANDLIPAKARVLLQLALTRTADPAALQAIFDTY